MDEFSGKAPRRKKAQFLRERIVALAGLAAALGIMAAILTLYFTNETLFEDLKAYGYLGAFLVSIILNGTVLLPVSNVAVMASLGMALPVPVFVGLAGGAGAAIGELTGYTVGRSGRDLLARNVFYARLEAWVKRWGWSAVFVLSVFPLVFDVVGIIAGALRMPLWKFFLACGAGRAVFYTMVAYLGALWFKNIPPWAFAVCFAGVIAVAWLATRYLNKKAANDEESGLPPAP